METLSTLRCAFSLKNKKKFHPSYVLLFAGFQVGKYSGPLNRKLVIDLRSLTFKGEGVDMSIIDGEYAGIYLF